MGLSDEEVAQVKGSDLKVSTKGSSGATYKTMGDDGILLFGGMLLPYPGSLTPRYSVIVVERSTWKKRKALCYRPEKRKIQSVFREYQGARWSCGGACYN